MFCNHPQFPLICYFLQLEHMVMLAPRVPLMKNDFDPDHLEVLEQAKTLRQMGTSDWEIEAVLNIYPHHGA